LKEKAEELKRMRIERRNRSQPMAGGSQATVDGSLRRAAGRVTRRLRLSV
jgi:hypothetical protein